MVVLIDMSYMFYGCNNLNNIDISSFITYNVTDMSYMFYGCNNLKSLDLSKLDRKNITNMSYMFYDCKYLNNIDISSFDIDNLITMNYMLNLYNINNSFLENEIHIKVKAEEYDIEKKNYFYNNLGELNEFKNYFIH